MIHTYGKSSSELRINREIRTDMVRLVGAEGQSQIIGFEEALRMAQDAGSDLVEINASVRPPICKIMDYGKYKFVQEKKSKESKKKQHVVKIKEVQLRPNIEKHDLDFKMKRAAEFLQQGDKVKTLVMFKGREITHRELGEALVHRVLEMLAPYGQPEKNTVLEGRSLITVFLPVKKSAKKKESNDAQKKDQ